MKRCSNRRESDSVVLGNLISTLESVNISLATTISINGSLYVFKITWYCLKEILFLFQEGSVTA